MGLKAIPAAVLEIDDAPLGLPRRRKVAGDQNVEIAVAVEIRHYGLRRAIDGIEVALDEVARAVVLENPHAMIRFQDAREVEVVAVDVHDVELAVAVEVVELEMHGAVDRRKARQHARRGKVAGGVARKLDDALIPLREQRDEIGHAIAREITELEANRPRTLREHLALVRVAARAIQGEAAEVVAVCAKEEVGARAADEDGTIEGVDQNPARPERRSSPVVLDETPPRLVVGVENAGEQDEHAIAGDDRAGRRAGDSPRREEPALPVEHTQQIAARLADIEAAIRRIDLEQRDDAAALKTRDERPDAEERRIGDRLGPLRKLLGRERVGRGREIVRDDLAPIILRHGAPQHRNVGIPPHLGVQGMTADAQSRPHLGQHTVPPGALVEERRLRECVAHCAMGAREPLARLGAPAGQRHHSEQREAWTDHAARTADGWSVGRLGDATRWRRRSQNIAIGPTIASARIGGETKNGRSSAIWKSPPRRMSASTSATMATTTMRPRFVLTVVRGSVTMKNTNS